MGTHHYNLSEQFEFTGKVKTLSIHRYHHWYWTVLLWSL
jgi:hypothetical protein